MKNFMVADLPDAQRQYKKKEKEAQVSLDLFPFGTAMTQAHVTSLSGGRGGFDYQIDRCAFLPSVHCD